VKVELAVVVAVILFLIIGSGTAIIGIMTLTSVLGYVEVEFGIIFIAIGSYLFLNGLKAPNKSKSRNRGR